MPTTIPTTNWGLVALGVKSGEPAAMQSLYEWVNTVIRFKIAHQTGSEKLDDQVHDCYVAAVTAIRKGQLVTPDFIRGYVKTIAQYGVIREIQELVRARDEYCSIDDCPAPRSVRLNPEELLSRKEQFALVPVAMMGMKPMYRHLIIRAFLNEEKAAVTMAAMHLTEGQYRTEKNRAKGQLVSRVQRMIRRDGLKCARLN